MTAFVTLDGISVATPEGRALFENLTLSVGCERIGLVGRNGSGKSTLLALIAGWMKAFEGHVSTNAKVAMVGQVPNAIGSFADILGVADALDRLDRLDRGEGDVADAEQADWTLPERLSRLRADAGLLHIPFDRPATSLSGGERTRAAIAAAMLAQPDLLLLDEPTNNLDREGRAMVMALLDAWSGGLIIASHDRELLDAMDRIVALSSTGVTIFGGGWTAFAEARDAELQRAEQAASKADEMLAIQKRSVQVHTEKKAQRDRKGKQERIKGSNSKLLLDAKKDRSGRTMSRDKAVAARLLGDALDQQQTARARLEIVAPLTIDIPPSGLPSNRKLAELKEVALDRNGKRLFGPLSLTIEGPQRLAVSGPNGSGKTSLLQLITGVIEPSTGSAWRADGAVAMLDQHVAIIDPYLSLLDNLRGQSPELSPNEAHAILARFAFRNRDAEKLGGQLSGGERLRAGLAMVLGTPKPAQLLILDEPTNHLDIDSVATLSQALLDYDGALLAVSHDQRFLSEIGIEQIITLGQ